MNYGFLIDNDSCIGCHACSTACKSENDVPLGVQRTWVKSVETGVYPNVRRSFQVTRCNHCSNPPCVRICPVTAMYKRADGIVEFDPDVCVGCKACMQACPYDAIYIDPESGTAAKCHYCGHRIEMGMEPACVVICPEHAILAGDLDDPDTEIARVVAEKKVTVRKIEKATSPNLFYVGGEHVAMHPTATERTPESYAWADVIPLHGDGGHGHVRMADQMTQVVYNAQHKVPWHWPVPAYLVTKGVGTGIIMLLSLSLILGSFPTDPFSVSVIGFLSLLFTGLTTGLLVLDLERPERFIRIVIRPQWKSWLVRGAYLLLGFSAVTFVWWAGELALWQGMVDGSEWIPARNVLFAIGFPLAVGSAVYTAFLFGQAKGRDLWQSALLPIHLVIQAVVAGSAALMILESVHSLEPGFSALTRAAFWGGLVLDLLVTLLGEFAMPHSSEAAARAAHEITHGRYARHFWLGSIFMGHILPLVLLFSAVTWVGSISGLLVLTGLYLYEYAFVMAPQELPNS